MWTAAPVAPPRPTSELNHGPIKLSVGPAFEDPRQWQWFYMNFGRHSSLPQAECLKTWPTEAIALARQALDDLEAYLEAHRCDTPQ